MNATMYTVTLVHEDGSEVDVNMTGAAILSYLSDPDDSFIVRLSVPVHQPARARPCGLCGGEGEHDWEVHGAEARAPVLHP